MATRIEQHIQDDCLTADQVRDRAVKTYKWRHSDFPIPGAIPCQVITITAPEPIPELPKTETSRDWLYCDTARSRENKWPMNFISHVKSVVCKEFDVSYNEMDSPRRDVSVVIPRHIAMYLARNMTTKSLPEIGRKFGNRDHTTIMNAIRKTQLRMCADRKLCQIVAELQVKLETELAEWRNL